MPRTPEKKLTVKRIEGLETEKAQQDFADHQTPGLCLRVSGATGRKTWLLSYKTNGGRSRRMKIGTYPSLGLAAARKLAHEKLTEIEAGGDPLRDRNDRQSDSHSFEALANEVLEARARKIREVTLQEYRRNLERDLLPEWGDRPAGEITRRDVVLLVEKIGRRAPVMARQTLALISLLFNEGLGRGFPGVESNPAHKVKAPGKAESRDRYLTTNEIRTWWNGLQEENPGTRCLFRLALLTAQRIGNLCSLRWDRIDGALWTIPASEFKGKRTHLVPLSPEALAILEELEEIRISEEWVFPSPRKGQHLGHPGVATVRLRDRIELPHWTLHDLRTTFRTHATRAKEDGGLGISREVADAVLGHKEMTLGFDRYQGDRERYLLHEKREALTAWGAFVRGIVEGGNDA